MRTPWKRRTLFAILIAICIVLAYFPEKQRVAITFTPSDPATLGLSGALGQLGAMNSVFGNQAQIEVALRIANSVYTRQNVIRHAGLVKRLGVANELEASRWLADNVKIRSMRGSIIQAEYIGRDPALGALLVNEITNATQNRLAEIARRQTAYKRQILEELVEDGNRRLDIAKREYNNFRLKTRYSDPTSAIASIGERIPVLKAALAAKRVELSAARQFATSENMSVRQIEAQIDALTQQLKEFQALSPTAESSLGRVVTESTEADRLERRLLLAQTLYDAYVKFLQGTMVEDLTSTANVRILEPSFVDTSRQVNFTFVGLGILLALVFGAIEFYGWRPPVGDRLGRA